MKNTDKAFFGHPIGLAILFFTEMWERFSYYGMRALLVLYIASSLDDGGLGWTNAEAIALYGWYTMLVYLMSIPGGYIADRFIGQKKTVMLGGFLLVIGHSVLAIDNMYAFFTGLAFIILGVGGLKPNISTMVGGLYREGDPRRDKGFTIFYIGINLGSFLSSILVGYIGEVYGWHYGFGLAGIGMLLGQLVFIWGQKYLTHVGNYTEAPKVENTNQDKALTKEEKDRMLVLAISFVIIIVFWGAFEQAGGMMNIYAKEKINRDFFSLFVIPASVFQSVNSFFIIVFGTAVASFWVVWQKWGREASSLFKMAIGTIIMGLGFLMMAGASLEASAEPFGKAAMYWLILAYLLHTIGELSSSPVSLSFITKLSPVKYASIMMGLYFAATGLGNKVAAFIGESAQFHPIEVNLNTDKSNLKEYQENYKSIEEDKGIDFKGKVYLENNELVIQEFNQKKEIDSFLSFDTKNQERFKSILAEENATKEKPLHVIIFMEKDFEAKKIKSNKGNGKDYEGSIRIMEIENRYELNTFLFITVFTVAFGLLLILFLKPLKRLTHGAEEKELTYDEKEDVETIETAQK
jgi:dipeptide/tripeptide permease